jgi:hypothetical protein
MARIKILSFFLVLSELFIAQNNVYRDTIPVFESGNKLLMPWAGGINFSSFTTNRFKCRWQKRYCGF